MCAYVCVVGSSSRCGEGGGPRPVSERAGRVPRAATNRKSVLTAWRTPAVCGVEVPGTPWPTPGSPGVLCAARAPESRVRGAREETGEREETDSDTERRAEARGSRRLVAHVVATAHRDTGCAILYAKNIATGAPGPVAPAPRPSRTPTVQPVLYIYRKKVVYTTF